MARNARRQTQAAEKEYPRFEGSAFSNAECEFLIAHLGEAPIVALADDVELPEGANEAELEPALQMAFELNTLQQAMRDKSGDDEIEIWCGVDALKRVLAETLQWRAQVQELKKRTRGASAEIRRAAGAPSLHLWDPDTDIPYSYGVGADADRVLHALGENGIRIPLYIEPRMNGLAGLNTLVGVAKFVRSSSVKEQQDRISAQAPAELVFANLGVTSTIACPLCGHAETYETAKPQTKKAALARMGRHLGTATAKKDAHRVLKQRLASGKAGSASNRRKVEAARAAQDDAEA